MKKEDGNTLVFAQGYQNETDNRAEIPTLCLEVNVNEDQIVMKIKMLIYPEDGNSYLFIYF